MLYFKEKVTLYIYIWTIYTVESAVLYFMNTNKNTLFENLLLKIVFYLKNASYLKVIMFSVSSDVFTNILVWIIQI